MHFERIPTAAELRRALEHAESRARDEFNRTGRDHDREVLQAATAAIKAARKS